MKKRLHFYVIAALLLLYITVSSTAQIIDGNYEVAIWKDFKEAAITYTFDDGCANQYSVAIPMLNEFNYNATFFPVINWSPNWTSLQDAENQGHEIGSHTVSHTDLNTLSISQQDNELKNSQSTINSNISGQKCLTIAYPSCIPSDQATCEKYYIAARHCQGYVENSTPANFYSISSIVCGNQGAVKTVQNFKERDEAAATSNGWCVYLIHGIDGDGGFSALSSDTLRKSFEYLDENRDKFWVSTFVRVVCYIRERNCISVTEQDVHENFITVEVTDTLDNSIYNHPVTLRRSLPGGWDTALIKQNGVIVESRIREINLTKYVEFNVVPDGGLVVIAESNEVNALSNQANTSSINIVPNPFTNELTVSTNGIFQYFIHSLDGKLIENGTSNNTKRIGGILSPGVYLLNIRNDFGSYSMKIIKK